MHFVNIVSSHQRGSVFNDALIHLFKMLESSNNGT